ncbi:hypothetical protein [Streptomyces sp. NBC_00859]|uniref:hypothetical protein n=1 Tax=Streptomyces sp. NBC_00859 TaxID=2903682 RepID=UPI003865428D|nr:hypothetical protein OG584_09755 [Streptomyces sp. NBC_00859]
MGAVDGCRATGGEGRGAAADEERGPAAGDARPGVAVGRCTAYGEHPRRRLRRCPRKNPLRDLLRGEWLRIAVGPARAFARRGVPGVSLGVVAVFSVIAVHMLIRTHAGAGAIRVTGEVRGDLPVPLVLLRTPVSLVITDPGLPVWAGLPKLFLAFALAELLIGRTRTLLIAFGTSLAGTLGARAMIALGHGPIGLPPGTAHLPDTGPSAAVAGLLAYLAVVRRAPVFAVATSGVIVLQSVLRPNLAGREHLLAVALALVLGVCTRSGRRGRGGATGSAGAAGVVPEASPQCGTTPAAYRRDAGEDRDANGYSDDARVPGRVHRGAGP